MLLALAGLVGLVFALFSFRVLRETASDRTSTPDVNPVTNSEVDGVPEYRCEVCMGSCRLGSSFITEESARNDAFDSLCRHLIDAGRIRDAECANVKGPAWMTKPAVECRACLDDSCTLGDRSIDEVNGRRSARRRACQAAVPTGAAICTIGTVPRWLVEVAGAMQPH